MLSRIAKKSEPSRLYYDISYGRMDYAQLGHEKGLIRKIIALINMFIESCKETDLPGVCSQMAFIILFALLPTLLFIILICTHFIPDFDNTFMLFIKTLTPVESYNYISSEIELLLSYVNRLRYFITAASALMGTLSAHTILIGINQTYGFAPYSSSKWEWIKSFIMLLVLCLILVGIALSLVWASLAASEVAKTEVIVSERTVSYSFMGAAAILGIFIILLGVFVFTPQRRITVRDAWPGALFATLGIVIVFQIYVRILNRSVNYLTIYGSLSGLFILLTALYFLSAMVTMGAKINTFFAHRDLKRR